MEQNPDENKTGRGIEGIAHHFLSGMTNRPIAPQRQSPQAGLPLSSEPPQSDTDKPITSLTESSPLTKIIVFADHLEQPSEKVNHFVQQMVNEEGPMSLLDLTDAAMIQLSEFRAGKSSTCELELIDQSIHTAWQELFGGNNAALLSQKKTGEEFSRLIEGLPEKVETVAVHLPRQLDENTQRLLQGADQAVLLCGCQSEQLLKTYQLIKRIVTKVEGMAISLFFFGQKDEEEAVAVYEKLAETCKEFLECQIEWAGCEQPIGASEVKLTVTTRDDVTTEIVHKLFGKDETQNSGEVKEPSEKVVTKRSAGIQAPLVVNVLPTDDVMLTKELARQSDRWLGMEGVRELELPLPEEFGNRAVVLTDGTGKLFVLMAELEETQSNLSQAMLVRGWLRKNFLLIQGYCRDNLISEKEDVGLILVGNSPVDRLNEVWNQLDFTCLVKQMYLLETGAFKGILVV